MKEYPVFIPSGHEHLGAVITVPDSEPRGIVLLAPGGGGAPRSHRFALWTKLARRLAEKGICSVRMEWPGVGDSTGRLFLGFDELPVHHLITVAKFAMASTRTHRLGIAGNCGGARAAIQAVPALPSCESMVFIFLNPLGSTAARADVIWTAKSLLARFPAPVRALARRSYLLLRRLLVALKTIRKGKGGLIGQLRNLGTSVDLLLLESDTELAGKLPKFVESMQRKGGPRRIGIDYLSGTTMRQFESQAEQETVIEAASRWFERSFGDEPSLLRGAVGEMDTGLDSEREILFR